MVTGTKEEKGGEKGEKKIDDFKDNLDEKFSSKLTIYNALR